MKTVVKTAAALVLALGATLSAPAFADCSDAQLAAMMAQKNTWLAHASADQILAAADVMAEAPAASDRDELCRIYGEVLDALAPQFAETP
jgi:hypothetical protein